MGMPEITVSDGAAPGPRQQIRQTRRIVADHPHIREPAPQVIRQLLVDLDHQQPVRRQARIQQRRVMTPVPPPISTTLGTSDIGDVARDQPAERGR